MVQNYVASHKDITLEALESAFPKRITAKNLALVIRREDIPAPQTHRYFLKGKDLIQVKDATVAVCGYWSKDNMPEFLAYARDVLHETVHEENR